MTYFLNFLSSGDYLFYVCIAYALTIFILIFLKTNSLLRNKQLEKKFKQASKSDES